MLVQLLQFAGQRVEHVAIGLRGAEHVVGAHEDQLGVNARNIQRMPRAQFQHTLHLADDAVLAANLDGNAVFVHRLAGEPHGDALQFADQQPDAVRAFLVAAEGGDGFHRLHVVAVALGQFQHRGDRLAARAEMQDALDVVVAVAVQPADHRLDHRAELAGHLEMVLGDCFGFAAVVEPELVVADGNGVAGIDQRRIPAPAAPEHRFSGRRLFLNVGIGIGFGQRLERFQAGRFGLGGGGAPARRATAGFDLKHVTHGRVPPSGRRRAGKEWRRCGGPAALR